MKKRMLLLALAAALCVSMATTALAAGETTTASVPVTLTIINSYEKISVTCPASLPIAVVDGYVVTADTAAISNTATSGSVLVSNVEVRSAEFTIGEYDDFEYAGQVLALSINGCGTTGEGDLEIDEEAFPEIAAGESLALDYDAKISVTSSDMDAVTAAYLVFTLETV